MADPRRGTDRSDLDRSDGRTVPSLSRWMLMAGRATAAPVVGVDLGGTKILVGVVGPGPRDPRPGEAADPGRGGRPRRSSKRSSRRSTRPSPRPGWVVRTSRDRRRVARPARPRDQGRDPVQLQPERQGLAARPPSSPRRSADRPWSGTTSGSGVTASSVSAPVAASTTSWRLSSGPGSAVATSWTARSSRGRRATPGRSATSWSRRTGPSAAAAGEGAWRLCPAGRRSPGGSSRPCQAGRGFEPGLSQGRQEVRQAQERRPRRRRPRR